MAVVDRDKGYAKAIAALGPLGSIRLGVQGKEATEVHKGTDLTIAEIAAIHELGLGVPERRWLRDWVDQATPQIVEDARDALKQVILGRLSRDQALEVLALKWQGDIQTWIAAGNVQPPLANTTIERKGSSVPLVDSGQFRSAITAVAGKALRLLG